MNRKAGRKKQLVRSAVIASVAFASSPAAARTMTDTRLALIHEALAPRTPVLRDVLRMAAAQQSASPQSTTPPQTFALDIPGGPLREVAAALARATGGTVTIAAESIAPI